MSADALDQVPLIETVVTTIGSDGVVNCAAMGVRWGEEELVFWPFDATRTLKNLRFHGEAVVHLTDDVLLFVRGRARPPAPRDARRQRDRRLGDRGGELLAGGGGDRDRARPMTSCRARGCVPASWPAGTGTRQPLGTVPRPARGRRGVDPRLAPEVAGRRARVGRARSPSGAGRQDRRTPRARGDGLRATLRRRADVTEIVVTAPARLHFGMLDPAGLGARRFGGFGVGIESPRVVVSVRPRSGRGGRRDGSQADRATTFARRAHGRGWGSAAGSRWTCARRSRRTWGSARAPSSGWRSPAASPSWRASPPGRSSWRRRAAGRRARASASGRSRRPGWWSRPASPTRARSARWSRDTRCPSAWRCVLALPLGVEGLSGDAEERFFGRLRESVSAEPSVVAAAADRAAAGTADGRHRRVRRRADRDPARDRIDLRRPAGRRLPSARGAARRCAARRSASARSGRARGARRSTGSSTARSGPPTSPIGCALAAGAGTDVSVVDFDRRGAWVARDDLGRRPA